MHRVGRGSMRAVLIYQHATSARDHVIADALNALVAADRQTTSKPDQTNEDSGEEDDPAGALVPVAPQHVNGTTHNGGFMIGRGHHFAW